MILKDLFLTPLIIAWPLAATAQGTVAFDNLGQGVNAPVFEVDGVTKVSGSQFLAELFGGPNATSLAAIAMTGFLQGNLAGYFNGGAQTINSVTPGGAAWVQVDVWNTASGASFAQAQASLLPNSWWQSAVFTVQTGNPFGNPSLPGPLIGLGNSPVFLNSVPEPSVLSFAYLGFTVIFVGIRKLHKN